MKAEGGGWRRSGGMEGRDFEFVEMDRRPFNKAAQSRAGQGRAGQGRAGQGRQRSVRQRTSGLAHASRPLQASPVLRPPTTPALGSALTDRQS